MKKTVKDLSVSGKRVIVRCDFNVPFEEGKITDEKRIKESLPTIEYLISQNAKIILCSHMGRPKGVFSQEFTLKPVAERLATLIGRPVIMAEDVIGPDAKEKASKLKDGEILLLENLRFEPGEEKNDPEFAKQLASFGDVYVNDAFGAAHRAHASTAGIAKYLPAVSGFLMEKEITFLGKVIENPDRPLVAIMGGSKVSDKIPVIDHLLDIVDSLIIGGGMAYTFVKALGGEIGNSLLDQEKVSLAKELISKAEGKGVKLMLPIDTIAAAEFSNDAPVVVCDIDKIPEGKMGLDIGPKSAELFYDEIVDAGTVVWNGPVGVFEMPAFAQGTKTVAKALADCQGTTIVGGGDSAAAVLTFGYLDQMTHVSTGGGASLEFLEGLLLPGVESLLDK